MIQCTRFDFPRCGRKLSRLVLGARERFGCSVAHHLHRHLHTAQAVDPANRSDCRVAVFKKSQPEPAFFAAFKLKFMAEHEAFWYLLNRFS